jgi:hypothetical protein
MFRELLEKYKNIILIDCPVSTIEDLLFKEEIYWTFCYSGYDTCRPNPTDTKVNFKRWNMVDNIALYIVNSLYLNNQPSNNYINNIKGWDEMDDYFKHYNSNPQYEIIDFKLYSRQFKLQCLGNL